MNFNEVKFQDARTKTYLGSPSIVRLEDGDLLVTHDYFGPGCPKNHESEEHLTSVYRSSDNGMTWVNLTHIANAYWSSLFIHNGSLLLMVQLDASRSSASAGAETTRDWKPIPQLHGLQSSNARYSRPFFCSIGTGAQW